MAELQFTHVEIEAFGFTVVDEPLRALRYQAWVRRVGNFTNGQTTRVYRGGASTEPLNALTSALSAAVRDDDEIPDIQEILTSQETSDDQ